MKRQYSHQPEACPTQAANVFFVQGSEIKHLVPQQRQQQGRTPLKTVQTPGQRPLTAENMALPDMAQTSSAKQQQLAGGLLL